MEEQGQGDSGTTKKEGGRPLLKGKVSACAAATSLLRTVR